MCINIMLWIYTSHLLQEEDFLLENAYYSEMKDAGFFDADWEWFLNNLEMEVTGILYSVHCKYLPKF